MSRQEYRYPFGTRFFMFIGFLMMILFILLFLYYLVISILNIIGNIPTPPDRMMLLITLLFTSFVSFYTVNLYPNIEIKEQGIILRAIIFKYHISWENIKKIKRGYGKVYKVFVIETDALTPLHRIYGVMYAKSVSPSFIIISILPNYEKLLSRITEKSKRRINL